MLRPVLVILMLLGLAGCGSRFGYAIDSGWPVEEPPCCNSTQLPPDQLPPGQLPPG